MAYHRQGRGGGKNKSRNKTKSLGKPRGSGGPDQKPLDWDGQLRIVQGNMMQSGMRFRQIMSAEHSGLNGPGAHILALSDPTKEVAWASSFGYHLVIDSDRPLVEGDNPNDKKLIRKMAKQKTKRLLKALHEEVKEDEKPPHKAFTLSRVLFCVHKSIPLDAWRVEFHEDSNKGFAATLYLRTTLGEISIHNVHNPNTDEEKIDIDPLVRRARASDLQLMVGDFNLHHILWAGPLLKPGRTCAKARALVEGMAGAGMKLLTESGTPTYARGPLKSCIDLTYASQAIAARCLSWGVDENLCWDESDHFPIRTVLDIQPPLDNSLRYKYSKAAVGGYQAEIQDKMASLNTFDFESLRGREDAANKLEELGEQFLINVKDAMDNHIPTELMNPPLPTGRPMDPSKRATLENEATTIAETRPGLSAAERKKKRNEDFRVKIKAGGRYRRYVAKTSKPTNGVWSILKRTVRRAQPKTAPNMQPLTKDTGGVEYSTEEEKQTCMKNNLWSEVSDTFAPELQLPKWDPDKPRLAMRQTITEDEVDKYIRGLPSGKAAGKDMIGNEAIKLAREQLVPFITRFFSACFEFSIIPPMFRLAITVVLPKAGKDSYNTPKSWRPIALLPSFGKLLDRIAADRLKEASIEYSLLPKTQYGAPGMSTTDAVQDILKVVYEAWSGKPNRRAKRYWWRMLRKVTLMGLDISAAYDNVDRQKLLQILADAGLPKWYILLIHSFLSQRQTALKLPRSMSEVFFVNIGIPQGSPLSPLLFLFFTAPLMARINKHDVKDVTIHTFAYVDDTYLVAVSNSYKLNCRGLEVAHESIMEWATEVGMKFSPQKYSVMHFKCPIDTDPDCKLLPNIQGLKDNTSCLKEKVKVLGLVLDPGLTWEHHITDIEEKVEKSLKYLRKILGSVWGMTVQAARKFFIGKIRSNIAYGCAAWFIHSPGMSLRWSLKREQIHRLEKLQYECLKQVSGALGNTSQRVLEKELHIDSVRVFLRRTMLAARAKKLKIITKSSNQHQIEDVFIRSSSAASYPTAYSILNFQARTWVNQAKNEITKQKNGSAKKFFAIWRNKEKRSAVVNRLAQKHATRWSSDVWDDYRRRRAARHPKQHHPLALEEAWGPESLRYYNGLSRGQSTMLLQCRTEFIGLNYFLNGIGGQRQSPQAQAPGPGSAESSEAAMESIPATCPCGHVRQTVFHMFIECPDIRVARRQLEDKVGKLDFRQLLTSHGAVAADWAITHFKLAQFEFPREDSQFASDDTEPLACQIN
ncbi:hypothetical protein H9Q72_010474 [Fusarium xylarioides]|uniref:Reverse transcriptase domain-containing protein n=1 Tax=Fusarium xylarioides TaxID=221167 RepID=A0A9P7L1Q7_9HYPO|nr:hypothetical protein H9Q72_010474 [Fusarium xylarioides]